MISQLSLPLSVVSFLPPSLWSSLSLCVLIHVCVSASSLKLMEMISQLSEQLQEQQQQVSSVFLALSASVLLPLLSLSLRVSIMFLSASSLKLVEMISQLSKQLQEQQQQLQQQQQQHPVSAPASLSAPSLAFASAPGTPQAVHLPPCRFSQVCHCFLFVISSFLCFPSLLTWFFFFFRACSPLFSFSLCLRVLSCGHLRFFLSFLSISLGFLLSFFLSCFYRPFCLPI